MNKKRLKLAFYVVLLAVLLGSYFFSVSKEKKAEDNVIANADLQASLTLIDKNGEDLQKIVLENAYMESGRLTVILENGYPEEVPELALDESKLSALAGSLTRLSAAMQLKPGEGSDDLSAYGLFPPEATGTGYFSDGSSVTVYLGSLTADQNYYYAQVDDDPYLYLISTSAGERFRYTENDLADKSIPGLAGGNQTYVYLNVRGSRTIEFLPDEQGNLTMALPFPGHAANDYGLNERLIQVANTLAFSDLIAYGVDDFSPYGLYAPALALSLQNDSEVFYLLVGDDAGDGKAYAMLDGRHTVFTIEKSLLEPLYELKPLSLIERFVALINIDRVDEIHIDDSNQTYEILLRREIADDEAVLKPSVNGREVTEAALKNFYQALIGLSFDAEIESGHELSREESDPTVTVRFTRNDELSDVVCRYYEYNRDFYGVGVGEEEIRFVVNKKSVQDMLEMLSSALK